MYKIKKNGKTFYYIYFTVRNLIKLSETVENIYVSTSDDQKLKRESINFLHAICEKFPHDISTIDTNKVDGINQENIEFLLSTVNTMHEMVDYKVASKIIGGTNYNSKYLKYKNKYLELKKA
jgi:hypothetical protein